MTGHATLRQSTAALFDAPAAVEKAATLSEDCIYRYTLTRRWGDGPAVHPNPYGFNGGISLNGIPVIPRENLPKGWPDEQ